MGNRVLQLANYAYMHRLTQKEKPIIIYYRYL
jgi:hypothetical protein